MAFETFDRTQGIGGSDVPAILGVSPWGTPTDVWMEKTHHPAYRPKEQTPEMRWGTLLEPALRLAYEEDTGCRVYAPGEKTYWADDRIRYAHLDGLIEGEGVWEAKVPFQTFRKWVGGPPVYVLAQVQHYLDVVGEPWCDVSALLPGADFRTYRVPADPVTQANIRTALLSFWDENVRAGVPPDRLPAAIEYPTHAGDLMVVASDEDEELAAILSGAKESGKVLSTREEEIKEELKRRIGEAAGMVGDGWRIRWKKNRDGEKTDWKLVAGVWRKQIEQASAHLGSTMDALVDGKAADAILHLDAALRVLTDEPAPDTVVGLYTTVTPGARPFVFEIEEAQ